MESRIITTKLIIFLGLVLSLSSCSGDNQVDPIGTTMQMQKAIDKDDYEEFKSLFFEPRQSHA
jgi:hypothetical protein